MRHPFYAPDLEEIIKKEFNVFIKIKTLSRERIRHMYKDLVLRAGDNDEINQIMEDIKERWKKELYNWQMRGCMEKSNEQNKETKVNRDEL